MNEIYAAVIGASVSALLMVLSNRSNKNLNSLREIYHRLNTIEKDLARLESLPERNRNWRNR